MPGPKKKPTGTAATAPPLNADSDSDAPEEFTKEEARGQALQQRKEERHMHAEQRRLQQQRRRQRASAADDDADGRDDAADTLGAEDATGDEPGFSGRHADGVQGVSEDDLLPESVLQAVVAKEAQAAEAAAAAVEAAAASRRALRRAAKRQRLREVKDTVVQVKVLGKLQAPAAKSNYIRDELYGKRIKRSVDMLSKARGQPSAKFV